MYLKKKKKLFQLVAKATLLIFFFMKLKYFSCIQITKTEININYFSFKYKLFLNQTASLHEHIMNIITKN